jgi:hypothetical protein
MNVVLNDFHIAPASASFRLAFPQREWLSAGFSGETPRSFDIGRAEYNHAP